MKKRLVTGVIMGLFAVPLLIFPLIWPDVKAFEYIFYFMMMAFAVGTLFEMFRMYNKGGTKFPPLAIAGTVIVTLVFTVVGIMGILGYHGIIVAEKWPQMILPTLIISILILFVLSVIIPGFKKNDLGKLITIFCYISLGTIAITTLRSFSIYLIIYALIISVTTDVFAYAFGMKFGKRKMAPNISPNKSWEGAIAGTVFAVVIGTVAAIWLKQFDASVTILGMPIGSNKYLISFPNKSFEILMAITLTAVLSIIGQLGDLFASKLKRENEIKDFSNLFPGHGGILDRFDSLIFISIGILTFFMFFTNIV